ncbi:hypothetical protein GCM10022254_20700 [Actinomadura meridiana]|uniref:Uncharacterized protein n=1 Tax=Actinomadura meridiana TaxID=559626 RepID=A0ABP8BX87_9ACTN
MVTYHSPWRGRHYPGRANNVFCPQSATRLPKFLINIIQLGAPREHPMKDNSQAGALYRGETVVAAEPDGRELERGQTRSLNRRAG